MADSLAANPWRVDPTSGGLVYENVELRHGYGRVRWTDDEGTERAELRSGDAGPDGDRYQRVRLGSDGDDEARVQLEARAGAYGNLLELIARSDGTSESRLAGKLVLDDSNQSHWIQSGWRGVDQADINMSVRAGVATSAAVSIAALDATDVTFWAGSPAAPTPDLVLAQVADGGTLVDHIWVTHTYVTGTGSEFVAQIRSAYAVPIGPGTIEVSYLAVYFDLG